MINILIVDDDTDYCSQLSTYLKGKKHIEYIYVANSIDESNDILLNTNVDIILLDIGMPSTDGITYLEQLNNKKNGRPNVIFVSNIKNEYIINRAFFLGCSYYLCKPVNFDYVYSVIITLFDSYDENNILNPFYDLLSPYDIDSKSLGIKFIYQSALFLSSVSNLEEYNIDNISNILSLKNNLNSSYIKWQLSRVLTAILSNKKLLDKLATSKNIKPYDTLYHLVLDFDKRVN